MNAETLVEPEMLICGRLRLFSLYLDSAAAVRARWATSQISRLAGERWKSSTEMWNLNSLFASDPIRTMITQDAAEADVIVVDTAHGHSKGVLDTIAAIKKASNHTQILGGNIATADGAKALILEMLNKKEVDDVVALLSPMPDAKRAKIFGEFKTDEEMEQLSDVLRRIRVGSPTANLPENTRKQLEQLKTTQL